MPIQRLSLFGALPARHLESLVRAVQSLSLEPLDQFKTLTRVFKDESTPQGRRASDFLRIQYNVLTASTADTAAAAIIEVIDAPEISKKPVTSRIVHVVPCTQGSPVTLAQSMGYLESYAFFEQGYAILIGGVQMRIYQIFRTEEPAPEATNDGGGEEAGKGELQGIVIGQGSTWIVQGDVEAKTGSPEDIKRGTDDLLRIRKEIMGYVNLVPLVDDLR